MKIRNGIGDRLSSYKWHQNHGIGSSCLGHTNIERRGLRVKEQSERRKLGGCGQSREPESAGVQGEESDVWGGSQGHMG